VYCWSDIVFFSFKLGVGETASTKAKTRKSRRR
jgi:hypothetical protein